MQAQQRPEAIDTRTVYQVYAVLSGLGGFVVLSGWGMPATIRVFGSILLAAAFFAAALAGVSDHQSRRRSLLWFAGAHAVLFIGVLTDGRGLWGRGTADWVAIALISITLLLFFCWATAEGDRPMRVLMNLFDDDSRWLGVPRPRYMRLIREAAAQEERSRLSRDLHDSIKQQVFVIQTAAATAQARFDSDPDGARQALEQVRGSAREAMAQMEAMLAQLRAEPLETTGLVAAMRKQCEALGFRTGASVEFKLGTLPPSKSLAPGAHEAIFRVAQEALANIGRHARASHVIVALDSFKNRLQMRIQDDGAGFDPNLPANGMGIANMRARAEEFGGVFELWSKPGGGASVQFSIPYTVVDPDKFRRLARDSAVAVAIIIAWIVWRKELSMLPWLALGVVNVARYLIAWRRTRNQSKAAR